MAKNIKKIQVPGVTEPYNVIDATAIHKTDVATSTKAGIVKIGSGITVAADGTISVNATAPVTSVNGKTGRVVLTAQDVGARPSTWTPSKSDVGLGNVDNVKQYSASNPPPYPVTSVNGKTGRVVLTAQNVGALPSDTVIPSIPDNIVKYTAISNVETTTPLNADTLQGYTADYFATATGLASVNSKVSTMQSDIKTAKTNITNLQTDVTNLKTSKMNISGGTMTGALVAQNNTNYTTKQVRNIIISTEDPSGGDNGDIWIKYAE